MLISRRQASDALTIRLMSASIATTAARAATSPRIAAAALARFPGCRRVLFETGRMAPMLHHGLSRIGLPVVCVESRQAYQVLKSLATHKTDRNDARGLADFACTGFSNPSM
jgi:transposase